MQSRPKQFLTSFTLVELLIIIAILGLFASLFMSIGSSKSQFTEVCDKTGGATTWDGRQYQCIKP